LTDLLVDFPFVDAASRTVALSAIITAVIRPALPTAPMHCLSATSIGTGKSFLGDVIASIATGSPVAVTPCGSTDEELEKRLGADLMSGKPFIHIDKIAR
jgi:putative DNA primase/helicase